MSELHLRLGTRGSELARWQAGFIKELLEKSSAHLSVDIVLIRTSGDSNRLSSLESIGGEGLFTRELEQCLLKREIDLAVHSLKDLPTVLPEGLRIAAVPLRGPVEDVLVCRQAGGMNSLPRGGRVATGSPRRKAQLLHLRPDLQVVGIRGNVPTRLKIFRELDLDGLVLARAGLERLGCEEMVGELFPPAVFMPAVGQGALAVEIRDEEGTVAEAVEKADHRPSHRSVIAERSFLAALGSGCQLPVGALAVVTAEDEEPRLSLSAVVAERHGRKVLTGMLSAPPTDAVNLGRRLADDFITRGAIDLLGENRQDI